MADQNDEAILAADFAGGDPRALTAAYRQYAAQVHGASVAALPHDVAAAQAVTVATFVRAWQERANYHPQRSPLTAWLRRAQAYELLDRDPQRAALADTIRGLDADQQTLLRQACLDAVPVEQIAAERDAPVDKVAAELASGLIALRDRWEAENAAL